MRVVASVRLALDPKAVAPPQTSVAARLLGAIRKQPAYPANKEAVERIVAAVSQSPKLEYYLTKLKLLLETKPISLDHMAALSLANLDRAVGAAVARAKTQPPDANREELASKEAQLRYVKENKYYVDATDRKNIVVRLKVWIAPPPAASGSNDAFTIAGGILAGANLAAIIVWAIVVSNPWLLFLIPTCGLWMALFAWIGQKVDAHRGAERVKAPNPIAQKLALLEDDMEKAIASPGFTVDYVFVDGPGDDVVTVSSDANYWPNTSNWVANPMAGSAVAHTLAHESGHAMGLSDAYDYIDNHAGNPYLSYEKRLSLFLDGLQQKPLSSEDKQSLMGTGAKLTARQICQIAEQPVEECAAERAALSQAPNTTRPDFHREPKPGLP